MYGMLRRALTPKWHSCSASDRASRISLIVAVCGQGHDACFPSRPQPSGDEVCVGAGSTPQQPERRLQPDRGPLGLVNSSESLSLKIAAARCMAAKSFRFSFIATSLPLLQPPCQRWPRRASGKATEHRCRIGSRQRRCQQLKKMIYLTISRGRPLPVYYYYDGRDE